MDIRTRASSSGYVDPNFPNPGGKWDTYVIIYGYTPAFSLAIFAAAWFVLFLVVHLAQAIRHRSWYFITFPIGLLFEVIGYVARSLSAKKDPYNLIYFIIQYFFIVTAPVFLAAGIYTILSAVISRVESGRRFAFISPKTIIWFFVVSDVISTILQITGAALIGVTESRREDPTTANNILLGGLAYQVFSLGMFLILTVTFILRGRRQVAKAGLMRFYLVLLVATVLIYLRTCFRLAETAEGLGGSLYTNEVLFACLEFAPVALTTLLFSVWHPGRCVGKKMVPANGMLSKTETPGSHF
ncbi:hypothetical protein PFICI_08710 [Pestalotiopsis fici W106-1]|uniref:Sphingoid long-chain base transporter RSB1 n=1 Tax=Pestalotiopsis fici (strain W106-1 / CGMCC3.15140) TaxID=1229662 RepID=W3X0H0_PESFW|nr:uncharacterized protein PFICI_08710 [Pestalotiopsis fici W106-1]ETS78857.1 hypothetical protein PFICI_08710 [Pestalotiopsis fici W106-1]